jgi:hypothetical protein
MHAIFMPYGKKECVDWLIRDMTSQKLPLKIWKKDAEGKIIEEDNGNFIDCQIRMLPFGLYEFVFPKEFMDAVLTSLWFNKPDSPDLAYNINREISIFGMKFKPLDYVKKFLRIEDPPKFDNSKSLLWWNQHIGIIPIGIRYDGEVQETNGFWHEAI